MSNELPEKRLSIKEASRLTSLSRTSLYRAILSGHLLARKLYNKRTVILASDLAEFITRNETRVTPHTQGGNPALYCPANALVAQAATPKTYKRSQRRKAA